MEVALFSSDGNSTKGRGGTTGHTDAHLVVLVLSSHARSSRIIKEHMRIANMYEQRMVFVWAQGSSK
jgi:hypothetical protein